MKKAERFVTRRFVSLTSVATIDIIINFLTHVIPNVVSGNKFKGSGATWMACSGSVVTAAENFKFVFIRNYLRAKRNRRNDRTERIDEKRIRKNDEGILGSTSNDTLPSRRSEFGAAT